MKFTARDHAFVYGVIAQEVMSRCTDAEEILKDAITVYGLQRGSRMGQTCDLFGDERSMQTYLAYGEWAPAPGEMDIAIPEESPSAVWNVKHALGCKAWPSTRRWWPRRCEQTARPGRGPPGTERGLCSCSATY